ncbi:MAG: DUF554 domain-containing protein, partial [Leptolyngbyaceae bacterium]|nr:DUF554 domain-containing protein [Leptolyngbyaceae bacterium]
VMTVWLGTSLGLMLSDRLSRSMQQIITQGLGLLTLLIGVQMAATLMETQSGLVDGVIVGLFATVIGGLLGEWWRLEAKLEAIGDWLKRRLSGKGRFTEGFVAASLLFCIGPLAFIGSLENGLTGDNTLLSIKAAMDGLAAIALTSSFGIGVGFSSLALLTYQGGLSLLAGVLSQALPNDPSTSPPILLVTGVGGLIIMGLSFNLLEVTKIRIASFLPAIALAPLLHLISVWGSGFISR